MMTVWLLLSPDDIDGGSLVGAYSDYRKAVAARLDAWKRHDVPLSIVPADIDKPIE